MTTSEFCESTGLTARELQSWLETGPREAAMAGRTAGGGTNRPGEIDDSR
jgi:hypothetical protein